MNELEQLQAAYNAANEALKASPLYIVKEAAGAALQAAHEKVKAERIAARIASHQAYLSGQPKPVPVEPTVPSV